MFRPDSDLVLIPLVTLYYSFLDMNFLDYIADVIALEDSRSLNVAALSTNID